MWEGEYESISKYTFPHEWSGQHLLSLIAHYIFLIINSSVHAYTLGCALETLPVMHSEFYCLSVIAFISRIKTKCKRNNLSPALCWQEPDILFIIQHASFFNEFIITASISTSSDLNVWKKTHTSASELNGGSDCVDPVRVYCLWIKRGLAGHDLRWCSSLLWIDSAK